MMSTRRKSSPEEWPEISLASAKAFEKEIEQDRKLGRLQKLGDTP
jgi:hypothetical protein